MREIIDFHHHVTPPDYVRILKENGVEGNTGVKFKKFDPKRNCAVMKKANIDKAVLSISTPGVYLKNDQLSGKIARVCNDYIKETIDAYPNHYRGFGAIPFPAVNESLREIEYIFDTLKLDGLGILSNVAGTYFGAPGYDEIFQELNRRNAVVFIHPEDILVHKGIYTGITGIFERVLDTTRSAYNLFLHGYLDKYPNIKYILSHGGGALPVMADRIVKEYFRKNNLPMEKKLYDDKMSLLKSFYFDTAQRGPEILNSLNRFCASGHIVFGSDMPYQPVFEINMNHKEIAGFTGFTESDRTAMYNGSFLSAGFIKGVNYE